MDNPPITRSDQQTQDLLFITALDNMLITGEPIEKIQQFVSSQTRRIFSSHGATMYKVSKDRKHLVLMYLDLLPEMLRTLETLIHMKIPTIEIALTSDSLYQHILQNGTPVIINDEKSISQLALEFTDNPTLKACVPQILSLMEMKSIMMIPLIYQNEPIGLLEMSRNTEFTQEELNRFKMMASRIRSILVKKNDDDQLAEQKKELESMNQMMIGRELKMAQLKEENARLREQIDVLQNRDKTE